MQNMPLLSVENIVLRCTSMTMLDSKVVVSNTIVDIASNLKKSNVVSIMVYMLASQVAWTRMPYCDFLVCPKLAIHCTALTLSANHAWLSGGNFVGACNSC